MRLCGQPYAHWHAHPSGPVLEVLAAGDGVLSLSQHRLALHGLGGAPRWCLNDAGPQGGHFTALCMDTGTGGGGGGGSGGRAVLGRSSSLVSLVDIATGKVVVEQLHSLVVRLFPRPPLPNSVRGAVQEVLGLLGGEGITLLRGPVTRGSLCCATSLGRLALIDPRTKLRVDGALIAAAGGVAALDGRGDTVAAAGYGLRAGQVIAENCVKIFDLRAGLRLLYSLPTAGSPSALVFHPLMPASLLVAMPSALFCLADTATGAATNLCQADMASDSLSTATISSSGELVALGGSGGYVHLWGDMGPGGLGGGGGPGRHRVNKAASSVPPPAPPGGPRPKPAVALQEDDSFSSAPQYPPAPPPGAPPGLPPGPLVSEVDPSENSTVGLPPRVLEPSMRREIRMVDGVGYLPNPHFSRSKVLTDMVRELAGLRHGPSARLSMRPDWVDPAAARAERQRQRAAEGGVVLPLRYQYVEIRHYGRLKWEEFDFSYYNRTRFAGLENDLPNAYCNALLQALYFIPEFRTLVMCHTPEPDVEFCLTCELSFLFAMLRRSVGLPCQATNLFRTLRSLREAAALGLLDGGGIGPAAGTAGDAGAAAAAMAAAAMASHSGASGGGGGGTSETELSRRVAALSRFVLEQMHREASNARTPSMGPFRSGIAPQPSPANAAMAPALEVDLQYPPSREKAARAAEEARQLGLNRLPGTAPSQEDPPGSPPPPFSELLRRSLLAASATRAWLDEARGYALVRKVRVPLSLPPVLTVNVAPGDNKEAAWWLPNKGPDGEIPSGEANRLPWALAVVSKTQLWEVEVHQADTAEQLYEQLGTSLFAPGVVSGVYELCGAVFQIRDLDEAADPNSNRTGGTIKPNQGHLVTMVKVPQQYWDEIPQPRLTKPPPGSMAEYIQGKQPSTTTNTTSTTTSKTAVTVMTSSSNSTAQPNGKTAPQRHSASTATVTVAAATAPSSDTASAAAGGPRSSGVGLDLGSISLPDDLDDIFSSTMTIAAAAVAAAAQAPTAASGNPPASGWPSAATAGAAGGAATPPLTHGSRGHPQGPEWVLFNDFSVSPNCPAHEVTATYANQKLPCLLQYRQVPPPSHLASTAAAAAAAAGTSATASTSGVVQPTNAGSSGGGSGGSSGGNRDGKKQAAAGPQRPGGGGGSGAVVAAATVAAAGSPAALIAAATSAPPPVLTSEQFRLLCCSPPLQGPMAALPPFSYVVENNRTAFENITEANIMSYYLPLSTFLRGGHQNCDVLTLARVAVVVAEPGPLAGSCCLDDYVRAVEPVYDYLTRWSGIQPGDLDPAVSRHYTTTLKHTYLKLKHLLDCGCVFVGHDLRKDFRCINMVVPPEQRTPAGTRQGTCIPMVVVLHGGAFPAAVGAAAPQGFPQQQQQQYGPYPPPPSQQQQPYVPQPHLLGHDAAEDARMAMRLYHKYLEVKADHTRWRIKLSIVIWSSARGQKRSFPACKIRHCLPHNRLRTQDTGYRMQASWHADECVT
ncbi:hypothetical protein VOLCADRAFT_87610 [Volvox carteri f. nagariensis]|uniref:Exonuclease domain-containing protein n=1 Tax=Volvox carteri f. nagariensis TaxID=3068 RepID=D8TLS4_VOLCA|nr:uncharacterized protein VOLCADRAFT_87610 [Volvox carteri f. nagariensis]EFJ51381.1 hypothetical protein VOLCADRAFT_87610 [Volvox carteri f. nagariensis]|eukprot:XP_002947333.1 hypothetical protein VOLCADRAFT_87610 [Volvox carteri f. nagariensis]